MKFSLIVLLVLGLTSKINSTPIKNLRSLEIIKDRALQDDLQDFLTLVETEKIVEIFYEYVENDEEVQDAIEFIGSEEFKGLVQIIEGMDDVIKFYDYLEESGLKIYEIVNKFHEMIDLPPIKSKIFMPRITGGMNGLIQDIKAILPVDKIKTLYYEKLETSVEFKLLVERLQSGKLQEIINAMFDNEVVQDIIKRVKEAGINVEAVADVLATMFGIEFPSFTQSLKSTRGLYVEFHDFLDVIPIDKIEEIAMTYIGEDEQVQMAIEYTKTPEFRNVVKNMEEVYDVRQFLEYIDESGIDVYDLVNELHLYVGLPQYVPTFHLMKSKKGIAGLVKDILEIIPVDAVLELYFKKVADDSQFEYLNERIISPKFHELFEKVVSDEKFVANVFQVSEVGINIDEIVEIIDNFILENFPIFQIKKRTNYVKPDIDDFINLIPILKITKIVMKYSAQDPEVQEAGKYLTSEEFKYLFSKLQGEKDFNDVLKYIEESGVDIFKYINLLNEFLNIIPSYKKSETLISRTPGIQGMFNEITAVLPIDDFIDMYEEKMTNSDDFILFIERFEAPEFQVLVEVLSKNTIFIELECQGYKHGLNIQKISDMLTDFLGFQLPPTPVCNKKIN